MTHGEIGEKCAMFENFALPSKIYVFNNIY